MVFCKHAFESVILKSDTKSPGCKRTQLFRSPIHGLHEPFAEGSDVHIPLHVGRLGHSFEMVTMMSCHVSFVILALYILLSLFGVSVTECGAVDQYDAAAIIKKVEDNLNGESLIMDITMTVSTSRFQRTMKMRSYAIGTDKSFVQILYPGKDRGITFLKLDNAMWQYVPRIEKVIKIPASMMLQSWMGSDFTNDDLVKESSLTADYTKKILSIDAHTCVIELIPQEGAAVVWGKIIMVVDIGNYLPTKVRYFDEEGVLIRELLYTDVQQFGTRLYPTKWIMLPKEAHKVDHQTTVQLSHLVIDTYIDPAYFTKRALKQFSQ